jgi:hypothetical protein
MKNKLFVVLLTLGAFGAQAQVHVDFDKKVDFTKYKTFKFQPGKVIRQLGLKDTTSTFMNQYIAEAMTKDLATKGLTPSGANPDLVITYVAGAKQKKEVENFMSGPGFYSPYSRFYGYRGWWGPQWNNFWVNNYEEGTIIIDVYDAKTNELVWRAYAVSPITNYNEQKFVTKEIGKSFKHFPPRHG